MPVLGLRGTGSFSADERPKSYREGILRQHANETDAPLTALTSKLRQEKIDDPQRLWFEKGFPTRSCVVNGAQTNSETTIEVNSNLAKIFRNGDVIQNDRTRERMWVTADPSVTTEITVARGKGGTSGIAMIDGDRLVCIGRAYAEGSGSPSGISFDPTVPFNYTEIFKTPFEVTRTARQTRLRTGKTEKEQKIDTSLMHLGDIELSMFFGGREEDLSGSQPKRTMGGLEYFVTSNILDCSTSSGLLSKAAFDNWLEGLYRRDGMDRLLFVGSTVATVLAQLMEARADVQIKPTAEGVYGMKMVHYITPFGDLYIKLHPRLSLEPSYRGWAFAVNPRNLVYSYIQDTIFEPNVYNKEIDGTKGQFLTECTLEVHHEDTHGILKGVTGFAN